MRDLNPRLPACKAGTLATELIALVENMGFEPITYCLQGSCTPVVLVPRAAKTTTLSSGLILE